MKNTKVLLSLVMSLILFIPFLASAEETMPYADSEFQQVYISFYSNGEADFECTTYEPKGTLYVKNCQLQKKEGNGWVNIGSSTSGVKRSNANLYIHTEDYSNYISSGTYRVKGTFVADGYTRTKYSAARTF